MWGLRGGAAALMLVSLATVAKAEGADKKAMLNPFVGGDFKFDVSGEDTKASASYKGYIHEDKKQTEGQRFDVSWLVEGSVPLSGKDSLVGRPSLDALADGGKVGVGINLLGYSFPPVDKKLTSKAFIKLMNEAREACKKALKAGEAPEKCKGEDHSESFVGENAPWLRLAVNRAMFNAYWSVGIKGNIGFKTYKYYTAGTLAENSVSPNGYSGSFYAKFYPKDGVSAATLTAEYSSAPKAAEDTVVCKAVVVTPGSDCKYGAGAAPVREKALVVRGQYMRSFPFSDGKSRIGVTLTGSKDALSGDYGVEVPVNLSLPIFFGKFTPGVTLGYSSVADKRGFTASVSTSFAFQ